MRQNETFHLPLTTHAYVLEPQFIANTRIVGIVYAAKVIIRKRRVIEAVVLHAVRELLAVSVSPAEVSRGESGGRGAPSSGGDVT
ncbi:unnamed protein product [Pieris macdunnoughi]|uniref:Uncharacterized protein n=1 Tax=Pieris macdunnoughi TaxID=345717 RepID=A0A821VA42_9NEOP|nr:unnamed protein product [Pieris macdunnoughi]